MHDEHEKRSLRSHLGRAALSCFAFVAGVIVTVVVQVYGPAVFEDAFGTPARLGEQLDSLAHKANAEGYAVTWKKYVSGLHAGTGQQSLLIELSDIRNLVQDSEKAARPDEFRIYDLKQYPTGEPKLIERFHFRPAPTSEVGGEVDWRFYVRRIAEFGIAGQDEIVGYFTENRADEATERPVVIYWDDESESYKMTALLPMRPPLARYSPAGIRTRGYQREYVQPERLADDSAGTAVTSYAASAFAVTGSSNRITTTGAFFLSEGGPRRPVYQLIDFAISHYSHHLEPLCSGSYYIWRLLSARPPSSERAIRKEAQAVHLGC
jgi:hypothetical protein